MDQRDFALAIAEFERAYELGKHFSVLYNLGLAHAAVGRYRDARETLTTYLLEGGSTLSEDRRRDVLTLIDGYGKNLVRLRIETTPVAAEVLIDAAPTKSPGSVELDPGRHVLTARAEGYSEASTVVETIAGEERIVTIALRPLRRRSRSECQSRSRRSLRFSSAGRRNIAPTPSKARSGANARPRSCSAA